MYNSLQVLDVVDTWKEATSVSTIAVNEILNEKKRKLTEEIEADTARLEAKRKKWDAPHIIDLEGNLQEKKDSLSSITEMMSVSKNKKQRQKFNQMKKRRAIRLFEAKRVKRRSKTAQGNRNLIDSDHEEYIAKCIEDKATYHGQRHIWLCIPTEG